MHKNQSGLYTNNLSNHASLLLSASPTIINSPLQNNTNNPQSSPQQPLNVAHVRRQPSTPLLATVANLDGDVPMNVDYPPNNVPKEGFINFKKPQNEIFKKLDGRIQKIVAAHSNLNKLYALNDFSSLGVGPKRPFELPPQLPPPPPWVPKVSAEFCGQWNDGATEQPLSLKTPKEEMSDLQSNSEMVESPNAKGPTLSRIINSASKKTKSPSLIDLAISKLHQKRNIERVLNMKGIVVNDSIINKSIGTQPTCPPSRASMTPAEFDSLVRNIRVTYEQHQHGKDSPLRNEAQNVGTKVQNTKIDFQNKRTGDIVDLLKKEIAAVTKSIGFNFSPERSKPSDEKSLLLKCSPQTLYNTIRRETSLLLDRRKPSANRSSLSLLSAKPLNRQNAQKNIYSNTHKFQAISKPQQTIKVIVPPTEFYKMSRNENRPQQFGLKFGSYLDRECPQPDNEKITIEQYARCLDLVRSNDVSLQKRQEQLLQSESRWRIPLSNRPLRLRRIRGERLYMPASASYKATRKVGLQ